MDGHAELWLSTVMFRCSYTGSYGINNGYGSFLFKFVIFIYAPLVPPHCVHVYQGLSPLTDMDAIVNL
jgi:hypothetical protein